MKYSLFLLAFPDAGKHWEQDSRWLLLTISISERLYTLARAMRLDYGSQRKIE